MPFDPSKMSDAEIAEALREHAPPDPSKMSDAEIAEALKGSEAPPGWVEDIGKSAASGAVHTAPSAVLGLPGTLQSVAKAGSDAFVKFRGGVPTPLKESEKYPDPGEVSKWIGELTGFPEYTPKYDWGRVTKAAVGNAVPAAAGPGALTSGSGAILNALRYGLAPAAAGEAGANVAESLLGPGTSEAGRIAGTVLAPGVTGKAITPRNMRQYPVGTAANPGETLADSLSHIIGYGGTGLAMHALGINGGAELGPVLAGPHIVNALRRKFGNVGERIAEGIAAPQFMQSYLSNTAVPKKFSAKADPLLWARAIQDYKAPDAGQ